jgi:hypothetical protein
MNRAEMTALASPPCHHCQEPIQRVETSWHRHTNHQNSEWRPGPWTMVCPNGHRIPVEVLP